MNTPPETLASRWARADRRTIILAGVLIVISIVGLLHVFVGQWRPSPGGNPWMVPLICYLVIMPTALLMIRGALLGAGEETPDEVGGALPIIATAVWAIAFFYVVRHFGLVTGTFLSMVAAMIALSPRPRSALKFVVPLCIVLGGAFWLLFTRFAPILLRDPWLF